MLHCCLFSVFSGLGNVVTCSDNIPPYYCINSYWHKSLELSHLSVTIVWCGWFDSLYCFFIFCARDGLTAKILPPGEFFSLFVFCSWMQVMELCM